MTEHDATPLSRRTVLQGLVGATAVGTFGTGTAAARQSPYHVVQGDRCLPVVSLSGDRPVEELYDLHIPDLYTGDNGATDASSPWYGSLGTQSLQRENTTITFLYDGPEGLSLVVVHGKVGETDGDGGRGVSWTLTGATLADGDWVVKDDLYRRRDTGDPAATNYDRWDVSGTTHAIDWTWGDRRTDGGAFRSLGDDFAVTIDPAYNEAATLWDENYYDGRVTDWEVLSFSGDDGAPERYSLALDETVTLQSGSCAVDVSLDVRSRVQPRSAGVVPVVVSGPDGFDARRIEASSLRIGAPAVVDDGRGARPRHGGHLEDVDGDGTADLVVHVPTRETGFTADTTTAKVLGRTTDGRNLVGTGPVRLVDSADSDDGDGRGDDEGEPRSDDEQEPQDSGPESENDDRETGDGRGDEKSDDRGADESDEANEDRGPDEGDDRDDDHGRGNEGRPGDGRKRGNHGKKSGGKDRVDGGRPGKGGPPADGGRGRGGPGDD